MRFLSLIFLLSLLGAWITYLKFKHYIPILMYHRIADIPGDRNALPREKFEAQLQYLTEHGYTTVTPDMFYRHYMRQGDLPKKSVMLTFDDAYADNYYEALPLLKKYKMTAVVFPISNWIGSTNDWEDMGKEPTHTMTVEQLQEWLEAGMSVAAHSVNHPFLTKCTPEQVAAELHYSKVKLENLLNIPIEYFCYPYGDVNTPVAEATARAGYKLGFGIFEHAPLWTINPMILPRIQISSRQSLREFKWKVGKFHTVFIALRKLERQFKHWLR